MTLENLNYTAIDNELVYKILNNSFVKYTFFIKNIKENVILVVCPWWGTTRKISEYDCHQ